MKNTLPPFCVGQRVIRTVASKGGLLKKGSVYIVTGISFCCAEWGWRVSIEGGDNSFLSCSSCNKKSNENYAAKYFAPIHENFQSITLEKVLEEETKLISVN
jgi:hypothetical protein